MVVSMDASVLDHDFVTY